MVVALSVFILSACGQAGDKNLTLQDSEVASQLTKTLLDKGADVVIG